MHQPFVKMSDSIINIYLYRLSSFPATTFPQRGFWPEWIPFLPLNTIKLRLLLSPHATIYYVFVNISYFAETEWASWKSKDRDGNGIANTHTKYKCNNSACGRRTGTRKRRTRKGRVEEQRGNHKRWKWKTVVASPIVSSNKQRTIVFFESTHFRFFFHHVVSPWFLDHPPSQCLRQHSTAFFMPTQFLLSKRQPYTGSISAYMYMSMLPFLISMNLKRRMYCGDKSLKRPMFYLFICA